VEGAITLESLGDGINAKGKYSSKAIIRTVNVNTGRESLKDRAFTETNWGETTRNYLTTIQKNLRPGSFAKIATKAREFVKAGRRDEYGLSDIEADERAVLVDVSDDEGESLSSFMLFLFIFYNQNNNLQLCLAPLPAHPTTKPLPCQVS
jgi:hypothetical protein